MASITITIPDAVATRVLDAVCNTYGYAAYVELGGTQTKAQYAKAKVIDFIRTTVRNYEADQAADAARTQAVTNADSQITLS